MFAHFAALKSSGATSSAAANSQPANTQRVEAIRSSGAGYLKLHMRNEPESSPVGANFEFSPLPQILLLLLYLSCRSL
jgi:hypothetical protein